MISSYKNQLFLAIIATSSLFLLVTSQTLHYNCNEPGKAAITFDDGPHREYTRVLLDILKENNVKATFFLTGINGFDWNETSYKETVRRMHAEGHQIGSHTWSHPDLLAISEDEMRQELTQLADLMFEIFQFNMTVFRPPSGRYSDSVLRVAEEFGYDTIIWNVDTLDWYYRDNTTASIKAWANAVEEYGRDTSYIGLHHDVWTGHTNLTQMTVDILKTANITITTIADCINKPMYSYP